MSLSLDVKSSSIYYNKDLPEFEKSFDILINPLPDMLYFEIKERVHMKKRVEPQVPKLLDQQTFDASFDSEDPYIEYVEIRDCVVTMHDIRRLEFKTVRFVNVQFEAIDLEEGYFRDVVFEKCQFVNAVFSRAIFKQVTFNQCRLNGALFNDSKLEHVLFDDCIMDLCSFGFSSLKVCEFQKSRLSEADFLELKWTDILFRECLLDESRFTRTSLNGVDISSSTFDALTVELEALKGAIVSQSQALGFLNLLGMEIRDD